MFFAAGLSGFSAAPGVFVVCMLCRGIGKFIFSCTRLIRNVFVAGLADFFSCTRLIRNVFCGGIGRFFFSCPRCIRNVFFVAALSGFFSIRNLACLKEDFVGFTNTLLYNFPSH